MNNKMTKAQRRMGIKLALMASSLSIVIGTTSVQALPMDDNGPAVECDWFWHSASGTWVMRCDDGTVLDCNATDDCPVSPVPPGDGEL